MTFRYLDVDPQSGGPQYLEDLATGYWFSEALFTAVAAGVFNLVDGDALTAGELAEHLKWEPRGTERPAPPAPAALPWEGAPSTRRALALLVSAAPPASTHPPSASMHPGTPRVAQSDMTATRSARAVRVAKRMPSRATVGPPRGWMAPRQPRPGCTPAVPARSAPPPGATRHLVASPSRC